MESTELDPLARRARRAYELGRLRWALGRAPVVAPFLVVSLLGCNQPRATLALGVALVASTVAMLWRGGGYARALRAGLLAGAAPLALSMLVMRFGADCCMGGACFDLCIPTCVFGGLVASAIVALLAVRERDGRPAFLAAGALVACFVGSLGCVFAGVTGVVGFALAIALASVPATAVFARTSRAT